MTSSIATATPANPFVGRLLAGRYAVERLIGRGGMGLIYVARDAERQRDVVVKLLSPHFLDDLDATARFEREGQRLAQLGHPNIVEFFDLDIHDGHRFIVMEHIHGEPLRHYLKRRLRLSLREFVPIAAQILAAVGYAHELGVMLRDIKPSNIMLCESGGRALHVKLLDFGLAKLVEGDDVDRTKAHVIGTAGYLAPEQIRGDAYDVRVDVYALGILFFVMLTGTSPIVGDNDGAILYNHVHGEPLSLTELLPPGHDIPDPVIALVLRCMAKDPGERPADANEVRDALARAVPPELFQRPLMNEDAAQAIAAFEASLSNGQTWGDDEPSSSEWTRPHLRELLARAEAEHDAKVARDSEGTRVGLAAPTAPPVRNRRPPPALADTRADMERRPRRTASMLAPEPPGSRERARPADDVERRTWSGAAAEDRKTLALAPIPSEPPSLRSRTHDGPPAPASLRTPTLRQSKTLAIGVVDAAVDEFAIDVSDESSPALPLPSGYHGGIPTGDESPSETLFGAQSIDIEIDLHDSVEVPPADVRPALRPTIVPIAQRGDTLVVEPVRAEPVRAPRSEPRGTPTPRPRTPRPVHASTGPLPLYSGPSPFVIYIGAGIAALLVLAITLTTVIALSSRNRDELDLETENAAVDAAVVAASEDPSESPPPPPEPRGVPDLAEPRSGSVSIAAPEGAEIRIDGVPVGDSPFTGPIAVGPHRVEVLAEGFVPWSQAIEVLAERPIELVPTLAVDARTDRRRPAEPTKRRRPAVTRPPQVPRTPSTSPEPPPPPKPKEPKPEPTRPNAFNDGVFLPVGKK